MLPKGNVSKRHCRLELIDGRFVVTDQNSTNGTYVNRRRITQSTVVRQGDRIYIGDFILRIEDSGAEAKPVSVESVEAEAESIEEVESLPDSEVPSVVDESVPAAKRPSIPAPKPPSPGLPKPPTSARLRTDKQPQVVAPPSSAGPSTSEPSSAGAGGSTRQVPGGFATHVTAAIRFVVERALAKVDARMLERDVDESLRRRVSRAIDEVYAGLPAETARAPGVTAAEVKEAARRELLELGPITQLLEDPSVSELAASGAGHVSVTRAGQTTNAAIPFCSAASIDRAIVRLCKQEEMPVAEDEIVVNRQLVGLGFDLEALRGSVAPGGALLRLKRRDRVLSSFEDLVRAGVISRSMATFLRHCVNAKAGILVVGARRSGSGLLLSALCDAAEPDRILLIQDEDEIATAADSVVALKPPSDERMSAVLLAAAGFPNHRLVVDGMQGQRALAAMRAISEGAEGTIASMRGGTIERACARVCAQLGLSQSGMSSRAVADAVVGSFDIAIEVARLRDGRSRVLRICELFRNDEGQVGAQSVFDFVVERTATGGSIEGTFRATGRNPQVADDIRARGNRLDPALFQRQ